MISWIKRLLLAPDPSPPFMRLSVCSTFVFCDIIQTQFGQFLLFVSKRCHGGAVNSKKKQRNSEFINITFSAQSSTVITVNQGVRGGKVTELKKMVDTAVQSCPTVQQVFVAMRTENPVTLTARDVAMEEVREQKRKSERDQDAN